MDLWQKIIPKIRVDADGCWIWTGALDTKGYGKLADKPNRKIHSAHRLLYTLVRGPIPDGLELDHLCRVRACVNPQHLEPVTRQENLRRGAGTGGVLRGGKCIRGHDFTASNTRIRANGTRLCRKCAAMRQRAYNEASKP